MPYGDCGEMWPKQKKHTNSISIYNFHTSYSTFGFVLSFRLFHFPVILSFWEYSFIVLFM